ncbi:MAG TPA: hypothetical protein VHW44_27105 [Pseudonocardiaceae bacterium]|jgi:hypothetical protein|nr:hypothetical protein [Pseudonocardiaceae bacterium]
MDVLNLDWSDETETKGYEVRTALVSSARVGQAMTSVLSVANHRSGVRPIRSRGTRQRVARSTAQ